MVIYAQLGRNLMICNFENTFNFVIRKYYHLT